MTDIVAVEVSEPEIGDFSGHGMREEYGDTIRECVYVPVAETGLVDITILSIESSSDFSPPSEAVNAGHVAEAGGRKFWVTVQTEGVEHGDPNADATAATLDQTADDIARMVAAKISGDPVASTTKSDRDEAVVGQPGSTLQNISDKPSQELVDEALRPVTVAEFKTPEAAFERFSQVVNITLLSGETRTDQGNEFPPTPESTEEYYALINNIYSEEGLNTIDAGDQEGLRNIIATELWFINESGVYNNEQGTWHTELILDSIEQVDDDTYRILATQRDITNFHELDDAIYQNISYIDSVIEGSYEYVISNDGRRWFVDEHTYLG